MAKPKRDLRPMHRAAKAGDHDAAKALLAFTGLMRSPPRSNAAIRSRRKLHGKLLH